MVSEAAAEERLEIERRLIEEAKRGNPDAMRPIFEQYSRPLYASVILPRLGDQAAAEDVLRDTFITAIEKIDKFTWTGKSIFAWLRQIAVNKVYDVHRKTKRSQRLANAVAKESPRQTSPEDQADAQLIEAQEQELNRERIAATLGKLNQRYRAAIQLRLIDELPREQCAEQLGVSVGTFDVVFFRAVRAFRKQFGERD